MRSAKATWIARTILLKMRLTRPSRSRQTNGTGLILESRPPTRRTGPASKSFGQLWRGSTVFMAIATFSAPARHPKRSKKIPNEKDSLGRSWHENGRARQAASTQSFQRFVRLFEGESL